MLKQLIAFVEQAIAQPVQPDTQEERYRRHQLELQLRLMQDSVATLKSLHADIEALRLDDGDEFQGTGSCEWGHEDVQVTQEWPNLAIMSDRTRVLLADIQRSTQDQFWFCLHGDCREPYRCLAETRAEAAQACQEAFPDSPIHAIVPASAEGGFNLEGYGEGFVFCPKCGSRTDFVELPRDAWQAHTCVNERCEWSFIAEPDEEEATS